MACGRGSFLIKMYFTLREIRHTLTAQFDVHYSHCEQSQWRSMWRWPMLFLLQSPWVSVSVDFLEGQEEPELLLPPSTPHSALLLRPMAPEGNWWSDNKYVYGSHVIVVPGWLVLSSRRIFTHTTQHYGGCVSCEWGISSMSHWDTHLCDTLQVFILQCSQTFTIGCNCEMCSETYNNNGTAGLWHWTLPLYGLSFSFPSCTISPPLLPLLSSDK